MLFLLCVVYACVCPFMYMNGEEKVNMECHSWSFSPFSFETGLSLNPEFTDWLACLAREAQGFTCLTPILSTRVTLMIILGFYVVSADPNSGPYPSMPSSQCSLFLLLYDKMWIHKLFLIYDKNCLNLCDFELQTKLVSFPEDSILLKKNTWQVWLNLRYIQMGTGQTFSPMKKESP